MLTAQVMHRLFRKTQQPWLPGVVELKETMGTTDLVEGLATLVTPWLELAMAAAEALAAKAAVAAAEEAPTEVITEMQELFVTTVVLKEAMVVAVVLGLKAAVAAAEAVLVKEVVTVEALRPEVLEVP